MYKKPIHKGFTLIELMVVVAILAILSAVGYPAYQNFVLNGETADARATMMNIMQEQNTYYANNFGYATTLSLLPGFNTSTTAGNGKYSISAGSCAGITDSSCVVLTGTYTPDSSVNCATLTISSTGATGPEGCWD